MKTQLIVRVNEDFKEDIKEAAERLDLNTSEFLRLLYICYKNSTGNGSSNLSYQVEENLSMYKRKIQKDAKENV